MRDVMRGEFLPEGVRLSAAFEEPGVVPAVIREIDLVNPRVMLESPEPEKAQTIGRDARHRSEPGLDIAGAL